jgi:hypothetical protein
MSQALKGLRVGNVRYELGRAFTLVSKILPSIQGLKNIARSDPAVLLLQLNFNCWGRGAQRLKCNS